jgi:antitoxin VapB
MGEEIPMSLNIKSEEAHQLTRELARLTGESLTEAVTTAVRERLERLRRTPDHARSRAQLLLAIGRDTAPRLTAASRTLDHGELLYDERGLPH